MVDENSIEEMAERIIVELQQGENADFKKTVDLVEALYKLEEYDCLADLIEADLPHNTSDKFFSEIISRVESSESFAKELVGLVQSNPFVSPNDLEIISSWSDLIWDDNRCGTATAAINQRTPSSVLKKLATNKSGEIRYRVAVNKSATEEILCYLIEYETSRAEEFYARDKMFIEIAIRTDVTDITLYKLAEATSDEIVRALILANPNSSQITKDFCMNNSYAEGVDFEEMKKRSESWNLP